MTKKDGKVRFRNMCEGGTVVNSFEHECWKADISYEAVLSRGGLRKWTGNLCVETPYLPRE